VSAAAKPRSAQQSNALPASCSSDLRLRFEVALLTPGDQQPLAAAMFEQHHGRFEPPALTGKRHDRVGCAARF
jgi:hypothetical protein